MTTSATIALVIFVVAYVLLATEKVHRTKVALGGAALMLLLHITRRARRRSSTSTPASTGTSSSCCWA